MLVTVAVSPGLAIHPPHGAEGPSPGRPPEKGPRCETRKSPARIPTRGLFLRGRPPGAHCSVAPGPPHLRPVILLHQQRGASPPAAQHRRGGQHAYPMCTPAQNPHSAHAHASHTWIMHVHHSTHPAHTTLTVPCHSPTTHTPGTHPAPLPRPPAKCRPAGLRTVGTQRPPAPPQNSTHQEQGHQRGLHQRRGFRGPSSGRRGGTGSPQAARGRWD